MPKSNKLIDTHTWYFQPDFFHRVTYGILSRLESMGIHYRVSLPGTYVSDCVNPAQFYQVEFWATNYQHHYLFGWLKYEWN